MMRRALQILWPSFLMAGVLEMMIFSLVDPAEMQWFGNSGMEWSRQSIYTLGFVVCWVGTALSSALTALLVVERDV